MLDFATVLDRFTRLNEDAIAEGDLDDVVPFSDVGYYENAIQIEFEELDVSDFEARDLALQLAAHG